MKFLSKAASCLLAAGMLFSTPAQAIFAASDTGVDKMGTVSIQKGTPSYSEHLRNIDAGSAVKNVNDTGFYQRLPRSTYICPRCKGVVDEYIPEYYAGVDYQLSNPDILTDTQFDLETFRGEQGYAYPCLTFNYKAAEAGTTTVTLNFYYNYDIGYVRGNCGFCGNAVYHDADTTWYHETVTFDVTVKGTEEPAKEVEIIYTDGLGERVFGNETHRVTIGSSTPACLSKTEREGYTFKGWTPEWQETVTQAQTYTAVWEKNPDPVDPVDPDDPDKKISLPAMDKKIVVNGTAVDTTEDVAPGQEVGFELNTNIPTNLFDFMHDHFVDEDGMTTVTGEYPLTIHDVIAGQWTEPKNVTVYLGDAVLDPQYYSVQTDDDCDVHITMDLIDLYNKRVINDDDIRNAKSIKVTYKATLMSDAIAAGHSNTAWVTYNGTDSETDIVTADVYGIEITKLDAADDKVALEGATFEIKDSTGAVVGTVTTDGEGKAVLDGLKPGTYTLTETVAPTGYVRSTQPIPITISKEETGVDHRIERTIANTKAPSTGGMGTKIFTVAGAGLLAASAIVVTITRKKREQD